MMHHCRRQKLLDEVTEALVNENKGIQLESSGERTKSLLVKGIK